MSVKRPLFKKSAVVSQPPESEIDNLENSYDFYLITVFESGLFR